MSRPRTSAWRSCGSGKAEPRVILISSAVRSPSIRECSFFIHATIALVELVAGGAHAEAW